MSIVIGYKKGDTVYMGTDTRVIVNDHKKNEVSESSYKIRKMENGMLVAITADRFLRQTLFAYSEIFTLDKNGDLTRKHISTEIIPKLIAVLEDEDLMIKKEERLPYFDGEIIMACKDVMYQICKNFTVYRYEDYQMLGDASDCGQYVLANAKEDADPNEVIVQALDIISKYSQLVGAPYLLIDTKEQEYKLIRSEDK